MIAFVNRRQIIFHSFLNVQYEANRSVNLYIAERLCLEKKGRLKITYGEMCRGDYAYAFCITDVYGDDYITDAAEFHINKYGEISFYE